MGCNSTKRRLQSDESMAKVKQQLGQRGEQLAAAHLQQQGYHIVATNWRCTHGELDIVAEQDGTLVFVEVRTRYTDSTEYAFESITPRKQKRLEALAQAYLAAHDLEEAAWRIDVIAVAVRRSGKPVLDHVENALDW